MLSWVYQYAVGGFVFFVGLWLVGRTGELRGRSWTRWRWILIGGFVALLVAHGLLQWAGSR